jgi:hypothetical protein
LQTAYEEFYCKVAAMNASKDKAPDRGVLIGELNTAKEKKLGEILTQEQYSHYRSESERTQRKYKENMQNRVKPKS